MKPFQTCLECGNVLKEATSDDGVVYVCPKGHGPFRDEDKWAFRSHVWKECDFVHVNLTTIHRQVDPTFVKMLNKLRFGIALGPEEKDLLMNHPCDVTDATKLFPRREQVRRVNEEAFNKKTTPIHSYRCVDDFVWWDRKHPELRRMGDRLPDGSLAALEEHRYEPEVKLRIGALVVLLKNDNMDSSLVNGSQGIVCGFEEHDPQRAPGAGGGGYHGMPSRTHGEHAGLMEDQVQRFLEGTGKTYWPVVRFHQDNITRVICPDCMVTELGAEKPYSLLSRTQIPLALAWAMTVHKAQGLTLNRVVVSLEGAFEEGQVYVALSRAKSLDGLKIEGSSAGLDVGLGGNREVQQFLTDRFGASDTRG